MHIVHREMIMVIMAVVSIVHGVVIAVMIYQKHQAFVLNDHLKYDDHLLRIYKLILFLFNRILPMFYVECKVMNGRKEKIVWLVFIT